MSKLSGFPLRHPWLTVLGWLGVALLANLAGGAVGAPATTDTFLPASAESQRAGQLDAREFSGQRPTAQLVIEDEAGIGPRDQALAADLSSWLQSGRGPGDVAGVSPAYPSPDGKALLIVVTFAGAGSPLGDSVSAIESHLASQPLPPGSRAALTGSPAIGHDLTTGSLGGVRSGSINLAPILSLLLVILVLALVYRAPLAVLVPMAAIALVLAISPQLVTLAARAGLPLSDYSFPFVFAVTLGAGSNYGLFLISRYRDELRRGRDPQAALQLATRSVGGIVTSSAATVVLATAAMGLATLGFFRTLGPAVAISIAVMLLAGLTLTPALIRICGRAFFWPRPPRPAPADRLSGRSWQLIGAQVARHPAPVGLLAIVLLLPGALSLTQVQVSFDTIRALPSGSGAVIGHAILKAHFGDQAAQDFIYLSSSPGGLTAGSPELAAVRDALQSTPGVRSASPPLVSADGSAARFALVLQSDPSSAAAAATLSDAEAAARHRLDKAGRAQAGVLAGGETAVDRDLRGYLYHDFVLLAVLVGSAIYLVLLLLLRNPLAPLYLLASVGLSTGAAIGATGLIYRWTQQQPLYWTAPVFAFVFLIALGEDFNIYLVAGLREELANQTNQAAAIARAVSRTGSVISSAGVVMAAAFLLLVHNPVLLVQQIGAVVVIGVLLDTFLVRPLLVPALVRILGRWSGLSTRARPPVALVVGQTARP